MVVHPVLDEALGGAVVKPHLAVLSNPSLEAESLLAEIARRDDIIKSLQYELNKAMEGEAEWREAAKAAGRATIAAKGFRTKQAKAEARLEQIEEVVAHWRGHRPRTGPEFGTAGTKSFDVIEKALILMAEDEATAVGACNEAIDGLHMAPWESYGKRYARQAPGRTLRNSVAHALGDELRIEKMRRIARWVRGSNVERAFEMWRTACEVERAWSWAWSLEHDRQVRERLEGPMVEVDGVVTRVER